MASGGGFLRWRCDNKAWRVLFLDGEMPGADLQSRFKCVTTASQIELADPTYLKVAAADLRREGLPDLSPDAPSRNCGSQGRLLSIRGLLARNPLFSAILSLFIGNRANLWLSASHPASC